MGEACHLISNAVWHATPAVISQVESDSFAAWYALKVRNGGEMAVVDALQCRGFAPYCPTQKERRKYTDRMKVVARAVFPGYVFCRFDMEKKLPLVSCPGVDYIVGFAGRAAAIPEVQMVSLRRMIEAGATASEAWAPGDRVRVTHGALEGLEGILVREPRGSRLVISIELLNRGASLYIDQDQTSAA